MSQSRLNVEYSSKTVLGGLGMGVNIERKFDSKEMIHVHRMVGGRTIGTVLGTSGKGSSGVLGRGEKRSCGSIIPMSPDVGPGGAE